MKNRSKYYKKYYKKHKKEAYLKIKKWREKKKIEKMINLAKTITLNKNQKIKDKIIFFENKMLVEIETKHKHGKKTFYTLEPIKIGEIKHV